MKRQVKKTQGAIGVLTVALLTVACGQDASRTSQSNPSSVSPLPAEAPAASTDLASQPANSAATTPFPAPTVSAPRSNQTVPVPQLIPPTAALERVPQVDLGRPDPFATLVVPPTLSYRSPDPVPAANPAPAPVAVAPAPVATVPVTTLPPLPSLQPAPTDINRLPSVAVPDRLVTPRSNAQTIEISGVVEVGGKTSVIVQVPEERSSRYVHVGDYLVNGSVLVKRVEMGTEPIVVLEENGVEVTRYVGGGNSLAGLL